MQTTAAEAVKALSTESPQNSNPKSLPPNVLARFILRMTLIYGHAWVSRYGDSIESPGGAVWGRALAELTPNQIRIGIEACEQSASEWPPSVPKFRALALGIPSLAKARHQVGTSEQTAFRRVLWRYIDSFQFRQATKKDADRMLNEAYELAVEAVLAGEKMPESDLAISHDAEAAERAEKELYDRQHFNRMKEFEAA